MKTFPNDDNGDVLRRMQENGDDLSQDRDIDFTVAFPTQVAAEKFADSFQSQGYRTNIEKTNGVPELPWDVIVVKHMRPDHEEITQFEEALGNLARGLGGRNDGWGCIEQPKIH